ncbi:hypothetical protein IHE51_00785 [Candidatus Parvarchaeota archaeon]|uniref:Uncharacterized protein n=1 Tax=Candidatus Acidifodinimicrobium mancum TaxID=2898728 RepID=A0A8T3UVJ9_9ARCH|nr:hypothetical protein [Candidatus Acidifodinimicrobium mancum]MBE5729116.1 hypothetical protein [Candidatus Acidifodinimicrobium mancum]MBE5730037.1 hypothetical protein [Candidatus Acidifodinimicrobium mancum]
MFENLKKGWAIGRSTRKLVFEDKTLMVYPLISGIVAIAEMLAVFLPFVLSNFSSNSYYMILALFLFYFVVTFTTTYIIMAMFIAFRAFENGNKIGYKQAFSAVRPYIKLVVEWSFFYASVIMLIRLLESRMRGISGLIFGAVASMAIGLATIFVVPVILDKKLTPIKAIKESASFIFSHFGKAFGGLIYSDLYGLMLILPGVALIMAGLFLSSFVSVLLWASIAIIGFGIVVIGGIITFALSNIFRLIVYDFQSNGKVPNGFTADMLKAAVRQKRQIGSI